MTQENSELLRRVLSAFPESREKSLHEIERFSLFEVFFYRSTLWHHSQRVFLMLCDLEPYVKKHLPDCDIKKAKVLALVHDDAEMVTGDVQLGHKMVMSDKQLQEVEDNERKAIEELSAQYPDLIEEYNYRDLLTRALEKDTIEAKLMKYADKMDGYLESLHEVLAGNLLPLGAVSFYTTILKSFSQKEPDLAALFSESEVPLLNVMLRSDQWWVRKQAFAQLNKPHTPESILISTHFPMYDRWRELIIDGLGQEGIEILTKQKEKL